MKTQKNINVYKIEYEIPPKMQHYTACVAAETHEAAVAHVAKVMGSRIYVITSGLVCPLHDVTTVVRNMLAGIGDVKEAPKVEEAPPVEEKLERFKSGRGRKPGYKKAS